MTRPALLPAALLPAAPRLIAPLVIALLAAPATQAQGQPGEDHAAAATAASTCAACHGPAGISGAPTIPNLAGQKAGYLEAQLKAFKAKTRTNDFMTPIAAQLSDDDIKGLAAFWSSLPATPAGGAPPPKEIATLATLPKGFGTGVPAGFTLYQDKTSDGGGHTRRYANATAWKAAHAGQPLPDGSHIVAVATDKTGAVTGYETMESRSGWGAPIPPLLRNGDWNYGRFDKTGAPVANLNQAPCLACHKSKAADSYMFSHAELVGAKG